MSIAQVQKSNSAPRQVHEADDGRCTSIFQCVLKWSNQQIGDFFGDYKDVRELEKEPGACRAITRLFCLLCLLGCFGYGFYRLYTDAPNVTVTRVYLQNTDTNYAVERLYNSSASYGTDIDAAAANDSSSGGSADQDVLDCPCTTTTISWTNYVHFYFINYTNSTPFPVMNWVVDTNETSGYELSLSLRSYPANMTLDDKYISRDTVDLNTSKFCGNEYEPNIHLKPNRFEYTTRHQFECPYMVNALLTTKPLKQEIVSGGDFTVGSTNWNEPRASFFESPSLQNQKFLYVNTIRRLLAYQREQFTLMNSMPPLLGDNSTNRRMFLTGMTELWLYALDRFGANSSSTDLQYFQTAASRTFETYSEIERFYPENFAVWLYEGNSFLGMDVNWMEYYNTCRPAFCDVTTKNAVFHRTYTALALIGGLWGVAVGVSTVIIWPVLAFLLVRFSKFLSWMRQRLRKKSNEVVHTAVMVYKLSV